MFVVLESIDQWNELAKHHCEEKTPIVLDFFAEWCGPCKALNPRLLALSKKSPTTLFLKIDVEKFPQISADFAIACMPTLVLIHNDKIIKRIEGADIVSLQVALETVN